MLLRLFLSGRIRQLRCRILHITLAHHPARILRGQYVTDQTFRLLGHDRLGKRQFIVFLRDASLALRVGQSLQ
uniref:Putative secreted protein n=1 Tax=Anopheles darlingi TaxID=43151 RepID=A0A2M4D5C5_ANODA